MLLKMAKQQPQVMCIWPAKYDSVIGSEQKYYFCKYLTWVSKNGLSQSCVQCFLCTLLNESNGDVFVTL